METYLTNSCTGNTLTAIKIKSRFLSTRSLLVPTDPISVRYSFSDSQLQKMKLRWDKYLALDKDAFLLATFRNTNKEIRRTWYYVNSRIRVDSEKSESQMGFEPTTLRDLVGCSSTDLLQTLWRARVKLWVLTGTALCGYTATCWLIWTH